MALLELWEFIFDSKTLRNWFQNLHNLGPIYIYIYIYTLTSLSKDVGALERSPVTFIMLQGPKLLLLVSSFCQKGFLTL